MSDGARGDGARGPPAKCAQCAISIEEASLLLICQHHLCLLCAAHSLSRGADGASSVVQCRFCHAVTKVDDDAATYLEGLLRERSEGPHGGSLNSSCHGSSTTQEFASPVVMPAPAYVKETQRLNVDLQELAKQHQEKAQPKLQVLQQRMQAFPPAVSSPRLGEHGRAPSSVPGSGASTPAGPVPSQLARTPSPSSALRAPRPVRFCGQCEEKPADLVCEQCNELFCRACAAAIHRRGQMAKHNLRLHLGKDVNPQPSPSGGGSGPLESAINSPLRGALGAGTPSPRGGREPAVTPLGVGPAQHSEPVPFVRKFMRCPVHPEEPLQFFCLTCESECICAECALHGAHRNHDVLNLREAAKQLPERATDLLATARLRAEELTGVAEGVKSQRRNIADIVSRSRRELASQFEQVRAGLAAEERALVMEVQRCSSEVAEIMQAGDHSEELQVREAQAALRRHDAVGDSIASLNALVKLNAALATPPAARDGGVGAAELKMQLQRGFDSRLSSIATLAAQVEDLSKNAVLLEQFPKNTEGAGLVIDEASAQKLSFGTISGWGSDEADEENRKPTTPHFRLGSANGFSEGAKETLAQPPFSSFSGKSFGSLKSSQDSIREKVPLASRDAAPAVLPAPTALPGPASGKWARDAARFGALCSPSKQLEFSAAQEPGYRDVSASRATPRTQFSSPQQEAELA